MIIAECEETKEPEVKKKKVRRPPKLIMNLHYTQYTLVKIVARKIGFRLRNNDLNLLAPHDTDASPGPVHVEDFDVCWLDCPIPPEALAKTKNYQRISMFPGI